MVCSLLNCQPNKPFQGENNYILKSDVSNGKIQMYSNDNLIYQEEKDIISRPFDPVLIVDSVDNLGYFNFFKSSLICVDLVHGIKIKEVFFNYNSENSEKKCNLDFADEYFIFSSRYNLILFTKGLKSCFNIGEKICSFSNKYCFIENVQLDKINGDSVSVKYKLKSEIEKKVNLKIELNPIDSLMLLNLPPPNVSITK